MVLNHTIYKTNADHQSKGVHDQEMSHGVIEVFYGLYDMWLRLAKTTH